MEIVKQLLKVNPSCIHLKDEMGRNALHHATKEGHLHLTQIFIEAGKTKFLYILSISKHAF